MSAAPASIFPPAMFLRPRYVGLRATIAPTTLNVRLTPVRTNPRALTNMPPRRPPRFLAIYFHVSMCLDRLHRRKALRLRCVPPQWGHFFRCAMTAPGPHGAEKLFQSYPDTVACPSTIVDNPKESMEWVPAWSSGAEDCVNSDVIEPLHRFRLFSSLIQVISSSNL